MKPYPKRGGFLPVKEEQGYIEGPLVGVTVVEMEGGRAGHAAVQRFTEPGRTFTLPEKTRLLEAARFLYKTQPLLLEYVLQLLYDRQLRVSVRRVYADEGVI